MSRNVTAVAIVKKRAVPNCEPVGWFSLVRKEENCEDNYGLQKGWKKCIESYANMIFSNRYD